MLVAYNTRWPLNFARQQSQNFHNLAHKFFTIFTKIGEIHPVRCSLRNSEILFSVEHIHFGLIFLSTLTAVEMSYAE